MYLCNRIMPNSQKIETTSVHIVIKRWTKCSFIYTSKTPSVTLIESHLKSAK